jgi:hypothetical protein
VERVILSVKRADLDWSWDLELPAELPLARLVPLVAHALRWGMDESQPLAGYQVEAQPPHRPLGPQDTLGGAGVWDGAWLTFYPGPTVKERQDIAPPADTPSAGWRRLGDTSSPEPAPPPQKKKPSGGFAWKQIDE